MRLVAQVGAATCHGLLSHLAGVISTACYTHPTGHRVICFGNAHPATVLSILSMRTRELVIFISLYCF
jgi:hypothetical protein